MITVEIDPKDVKSLEQALYKLNGKRLLEGEWRDLLVPLKRELRTYPAPPPGSRYVRTHNLKRSWQYAIVSPERAEVSNTAIYAGYVQGENQAAVHQGRWSIFTEVGGRHFSEFIDKLTTKIGKIWAS